jgi:Fe-S-cluster containining protein
VAEGGDQSEKPRVHLPVVDGPVRSDLDDGLRFVHVLNMQVKSDLYDASTRLAALVESLVAGGHIDPIAFEERRNRVRERELPRQAEKAHVQVADLVDKYAMEGLPEIPCAELIPLCKARCCRLNFPLSFQDLDEGTVQWDYGLPYIVRKSAAGSCVHNDADSKRCTIYDKRPSSCRRYDCRNDRRIWLDFAARVPAPE